MIVYYNYIGTSLNGLIQEVNLKEKKPIQFLQKMIWLNKNDIRSHLVGHSDLKELDTNDFCKKTDDLGYGIRND